MWKIHIGYKLNVQYFISNKYLYLCGKSTSFHSNEFNLYFSAIVFCVVLVICV